MFLRSSPELSCRQFCCWLSIFFVLCVVSIFFVLCVVGVSSPGLLLAAGVERSSDLLLAVLPWSSPACGVGVLIFVVRVLQGWICWHHIYVLVFVCVVLVISCFSG